MTFRTDKRHRVQESRKSGKNVLKLASRLQHFISTGKVSKQDLKAVDDRFFAVLIDQGKHALQMLEQLQEHVPKAKGKDILGETCTMWSKWIAQLQSGSASFSGYSDIDTSKIGFQSVLLEEAVDYDTDITRMMISFNSSLAASLRKCSYEVPDPGEIQEGAKEIITSFNTREKILEKVSASEKTS